MPPTSTVDRPISTRGSTNTGLVSQVRKSPTGKEPALKRKSTPVLQLQRKPFEEKSAADSRPPARKAGPGRPESDVVGSNRAEPDRDRLRETKARLASAAMTAVVMVAVQGLWSLAPRLEFPKQTKAAVVAPVPVPVPVQAVPARPEPAHPVAEALNRLDSVLMHAPGSAQKLLNAARERGTGQNRNVCDFSWNGGQPALRHWVEHRIYTELDECASAVESYLDAQKNPRPKAAKAND